MVRSSLAHHSGDVAGVSHSLQSKIIHLQAEKLAGRNGDETSITIRSLSDVHTALAAIIPSKYADL